MKSRRSLGAQDMCVCGQIEVTLKLVIVKVLISMNLVRISEKVSKMRAWHKVYLSIRTPLIK
jgi:hypothetical protein